MNNKKTKNKIILALAIILAAIALGFYYFFSPVNSEILTSNNWDVERNGMYNHITFDQDGSFKVYAFPQEVDKGTWTLEDKKLTLDFDTQEENREYTKLKFDRRGFVSSLTDSNKERWTVKQ